MLLMMLCRIIYPLEPDSSNLGFKELSLGKIKEGEKEVIHEVFLVPLLIGYIILFLQEKKHIFAWKYGPNGRNKNF